MYFFPRADVFPNFNPAGKEMFGSISIFAHSGPASHIPADYFFRIKIHQFVRETLLDNFNPIDCHALWVKKMGRKDILANTDWDMLIH